MNIGRAYRDVVTLLSMKMIHLMPFDIDLLCGNRARRRCVLGAIGAITLMYTREDSIYLMWRAMTSNLQTFPVVLENLTKWYGKTLGINNVSFEVREGEVFGFLGPNGAGKTTTLRTLLGLIKPTSGRATILGQNALAGNSQLRKEIGYLPGISATYDRYRADKYLMFMAQMRRKNLSREIAELAERLKLDLTKHIHDQSKGNRQKVAVIQAFMHSPRVLLLDEPTSGLDPLIQREFEKLLNEVKARGACVILSSHVLSEVEHLADRVAVIDQGEILLVEEVQSLKSKARRRIELIFPRNVTASEFSNIQSLSEIEISREVLRCVVVGSEHELLQRAVNLGVIEIRTQEASLEEIFIDLVGAR